MSTILKPSTQDQADTPSICHDTNVSPNLAAQALLTAALAGDRPALAALARDLLPVIRLEVRAALHRRARLHQRDPEQDLADFVQEVWVVLLVDHGRLLRRWDPQRGHTLPGFVRLVARQRVAQILRMQRGNPWRDDPTEDTTIEGLLPVGISHERLLESREALGALLEHLWARLGERGMALFDRLHVQQRTICEVAAEFAMSRPAVDAWNTRMRVIARDSAVAAAAPHPGKLRAGPPHCSGAASRLPPTVFAVSRTPKRSRPVEHVAGST